MTPAEAYNMFVALKLHFTSESYDYFKYNGKLKQKPRFEIIKDKGQMVKLARHKDPIGLTVSTMVKKPKVWVRDLLSEEGLKNYEAARKYMEEPAKAMAKDLDKLDDDSVVDFRSRAGSHPLALRLYLGNKLSPITLCILNKLSGNLFNHWYSELKDDIVAQPAIFQLLKYTPFVNYDDPNGAMLKALQERFKREC